MLQREERRLVRGVAVTTYISERTGLDLPVDMEVVLGMLLALDILRLESDDFTL